jgi:hypothetical protein
VDLNSAVEPGAAGKANPGVQLGGGQVILFIACQGGYLPLEDYHAALPATSLPAADRRQVDSSAQGGVEQGGSLGGHDTSI